MASESPCVQTPTSFARDGESEKYLAQRRQQHTYARAYVREIACTHAAYAARIQTRARY